MSVKRFCEKCQTVRGGIDTTGGFYCNHCGHSTLYINKDIKTTGGKQ